MDNLIKLLSKILKNAEKLGLPQADVANAKEYLEYNEWGLCLDTIAIQMYEHNITIDLETYQLIEQASQKMNTDDYSYLKELVS